MTGDGVHAAFDDCGDARCGRDRAATGAGRAAGRPRVAQRALRTAPGRRPAARQRLLRAGRQPGRAHHECSPWRTGVAVAGGGRSRRRKPAAERCLARPWRRAAARSWQRRAVVPAHAPVSCAPSFRRCARWRARPTTCAQQLNSFVGRDREMEQVRAPAREQSAADAARHGRPRQVAAVDAGGCNRARGLSGRRMVRRAGSDCRPANGAAGDRLGPRESRKSGAARCSTR